ncbi:protein of unknown function [Candidatus Filomicrobium marinum]|nr:protein of unknown function [Candidatus Filomicrobium marinum]
MPQELSPNSYSVTAYVFIIPRLIATDTDGPWPMWFEKTAHRDARGSKGISSPTATRAPT